MLAGGVLFECSGEGSRLGHAPDQGHQTSSGQETTTCGPEPMQVRRPGRSHVPYRITNTRRYPSCALVVLARRAYVSAVAAHSRPQIRNNGDHNARSHSVVRVDTPVAS